MALKRAIYRVSALLETVDLEFERVLLERDSYRAEVAQTPSLMELLNVDTLQQILDASWPSANKDADGESYASLLTDLSWFGITTPSSLKQLISKWHDVVLAEDAKTVAEIRQDPKNSNRAKKERIDAGVFFVHAGLTRVALSKEFPDKWQELNRQQVAARKRSNGPGTTSE